jgi:hypothetical protein
VSTESLIGEAYGVSESTTPNGTHIYYQQGPKRLYRVNEVEVPSVSTVNDVLDKPALKWWGMRMGVQGILDLLENGALGSWEFETDERITESEIVGRLTEHKLTVNHVRDKAATRGTNVHKSLETWVETGVTPIPEFFPENERGYVQAVVAFINDAHPHAIYSELMVGSAVHGFAGRFDLFANLDFSGEVVTKTYPKRKPVRETLSGTWLIDAKTKTQTEKAVKAYESHKIQLGGYEGGLAECGYPAPDHKGLLHLFADGRYELVETHATFDDFLAIKGAYDALKGIS